MKEGNDVRTFSSMLTERKPKCDEHDAMLVLELIASGEAKKLNIGYQMLSMLTEAKGQVEYAEIVGILAQCLGLDFEPAMFLLRIAARAGLVKKVDTKARIAVFEVLHPSERMVKMVDGTDPLQESVRLANIARTHGDWFLAQVTPDGRVCSEALDEALTSS